MDDSVVISEGELVNRRQQRLHTLQHRLAGGPSRYRAALIFHHGYGEHSGRYSRVFDLLATAGIAVFSYDAHGHGLSEPKELWDRHLVWSFSDLVDDLLQYVADIRQELPLGLPIFLGGHSMGALTSVHAALRDQTPWHGLIVCSGAIDVERNLSMRLQEPIANILATIIPRARIVPAVRGEDMSSDPEAIRTMEEDPLNAQGAVRARTANELLKAFYVVSQREQELWLPIYAHHGSKDRLANLQAVKRMLTNASSHDKTLYVVPGGYHEVLMGTEREDCTQRMGAWMLGHLQQPVPHERPTQGTHPSIHLLPLPEELKQAEAEQGTGPDRSSQDSDAPSIASSSGSEQYHSPTAPEGSGISGQALEQIKPMEAGGLRPAAGLPTAVPTVLPAAGSA